VVFSWQIQLDPVSAPRINTLGAVWTFLESLPNKILLFSCESHSIFYLALSLIIFEVAMSARSLARPLPQVTVVVVCHCQHRRRRRHRWPRSRRRYRLVTVITVIVAAIFPVAVAVVVAVAIAITITAVAALASS
jgi:hypothetical protein